MKRRSFVSLIVGTAAAWPLPLRALAQHARKIGILTTSPENDPEAARRIAALRQKLHDLGWIEGKEIQIDIRFAGTDPARLRSEATALVAAAQDAIVSTTSTTTRSLLDATRKLPIVAAVSGDPIELGFTKSLSHPTENVTGFTTFNETLAAKRFEILRELLPKMQRAALIWVAANPQQELLEKQTKKAAETLGTELISLPIKTATDIAPALTTAHDRAVAALIVAADPLTVANHRIIIEGCMAKRMPAMHSYVFEAKDGALISYGIDILDNYRRAAEYVDRILRGSKISDLPFQEPTRFTLAINIQTARTLGIKVPASLLSRADEVIE